MQSLQTIMNSVSTATGNQKSHENLSKTFVLDMQKKQDLSYLGMTKVEQHELEELEQKKQQVKSIF